MVDKKSKRERKNKKRRELTCIQKQENAERIEKGQQPLPEDEVNTLFKLPPEPSRLDSMILSAQMHNFTKQLNQFAGPSLTRLYSIQELQK